MRTIYTTKDIPFNWDNSLRAPIRQKSTPTRPWLREDAESGVPIPKKEMGNSLDPSHSGTLSRYVDPAMGCEGDKSLPVMDEVMGSENEDSPLEHTDGLKRPQISSSPKTFSPIGDMGVVTREFSQTQSNMISTGLDIRASRKP
ncbi:hypothetical protein V6N12_027379 [Hibiscus sabdariffa]|uniref:Uncharacterized protein n=1 Tax=Hibiscus sabdariffa TaxID=183260 RepID=A0ABR2DW89_9ROSI